LPARLPLAVSRFVSAQMKRQVSDLIARGRFDAIVCYFLFAAPNITDLSRATLFQHSVEAQIWQRRIDHSSNALERKLLHNQHEKMRRYVTSASR
jgi:hypothetical protein